MANRLKNTAGVCVCVCVGWGSFRLPVEIFLLLHTLQGGARAVTAGPRGEWKRAAPPDCANPRALGRDLGVEARERERIPKMTSRLRRGGERLAQKRHRASGSQRAGFTRAEKTHRARAARYARQQLGRRRF